MLPKMLLPEDQLWLRPQRFVFLGIFRDVVSNATQHLMAPSDAQDIAASIALARQRIEDDADISSNPATPPEINVTDKYAFAFDIDGVLIRGGRPIPEAVEAMKVLNGQNKYGIKM